MCDINAAGLDKAAATMGAQETYTDYDAMLDKSDLDAVIIGTPMPLHVPQSIAALARGVHVLSEVPAGVSLDECRRLVEACVASKAVYMMAENAMYTKPVVFVRELARQGLFGELYYAEGEYLHELKELNEVTKWRRQWQTGIAGVTYGTHSLGPILQWMGNDRVVRVCCEDAGQRYKDPRGDAYAQTTPVMLCKTAKNALIKIRVDMLSNRPHAASAFALQGTDGCYESSRDVPGGRGALWLRALGDKMQWHDFDAVMNSEQPIGKYLPESWRNPPAAALKAGHCGGDYFEVLDFVLAITGAKPCPIGIHEAMDMTLPGLISQQSVLEGGRWMDVPDSRVWAQGGPKPQLQMLWPESKRVAVPSLPDGYVLRQYTEADEAQYIAVMAKAGFTGWDHKRVDAAIRGVLPDGFFVIEHAASRTVVATAQARHGAHELHPYAAELGWVAADPAHKGKKLGAIVTAAATARMISAGYHRIYLLTDDFRVPALKTYLDLGYEPFLFCNGMAERWQAVRATLTQR